MATTPPGQPWIEGGGPSAPYVLRWAAAGGPNRVVGYVVEKRVIGGGDGSFKQLTGNTGSKAPRFGLLSSHVEPASAYSFRVAALISAAAGHQQRGDFSEASEPLEALLPVGMLSNPSLGVGARLDPSMGARGRAWRPAPRPPWRRSRGRWRHGSASSKRSMARGRVCLTKSAAGSTSSWPRGTSSCAEVAARERLPVLAPATWPAMERPAAAAIVGTRATVAAAAGRSAAGAAARRTRSSRACARRSARSARASTGGRPNLVREGPHTVCATVCAC